MHPLIRNCAILFVLAAAVPAFGDDQDKANKEIAKVAAIAWDATGRVIVNRSVADMMGVKRLDLVQDRQNLDINYGSMFLVLELVKSGAKMDDIAAQLKSGKRIGEIAKAAHPDWKAITADAKKLNTKIDDGLYKHFLNEKVDNQRDAADNYVVANDNVADDHKVEKSDIDAAAERFTMWKDRAIAAAGKRHDMDTAEQQAAYVDHDRNGGPTGTPGQGGNGGVGTPAPAAGGARTGPN